MDKNEVIDTLMSILREHGKSLGDEETEITIHTRPIGGILGFDSLAGVTATIECFERLKCNCDTMISLFVGNDSQGLPHALTIKEAADKLMDIASSQNKG